MARKFPAPSKGPSARGAKPTGIKPKGSKPKGTKLAVLDNSVVKMPPDRILAFVRHARRVVNRPSSAVKNSNQILFGRRQNAQILAELCLEPDERGQLLKRTLDIFADPSQKGVKDRIENLIFEEIQRHALSVGGVRKRALAWVEAHGMDPSSKPELANGYVHVGLYYANIPSVDDKGSTDNQLIIDWIRNISGMTAYEYFTSRFGDVPYHHRPTSDLIRQASVRFYNTLAQHQSRRGGSINDLFPSDPAARGGAKGMGVADMSREALIERVEKQRESARRAKVKWREKQRAAGIKPT